jgi:hypothetical protein
MVLYWFFRKAAKYTKRNQPAERVCIDPLDWLTVVLADFGGVVRKASGAECSRLWGVPLVSYMINLADCQPLGIIR